MCAMMLLTFVSCSSHGKTVMTVGEKTLSVNTYEFLLSRMKGTLAGYGYNVNDPTFWSTIISTDGMTYNDYFRTSILEEASRYVIADYLFDKSGLELSEDREAIVNELMDKLVERAGSKNALNASLMEYGANYEILRDLYILEAKIDMLKAHLFGENGEKVSEEEKEKYLKGNYVAFGQIFVAGYYYLIDTDDFGDQVYYTDEKHTAIAYDTVNGKTRKDEFGLVEKDILGNPAYYNEEGRIAYDKVNGILGYVYGKDGEKMTAFYDDDKMSELYLKAQQYATDSDGDIDKFKDLAGVYGEGDADGDIMYLYSSVGYYAAQNDAYAYLDSITKELAKMDTGECRVVKSEFGYHVVCKYAIEEKIYDSEAQKDVFANFYEGLVAYLFDEECKKIRVDGQDRPRCFIRGARYGFGWLKYLVLSNFIQIFKDIS